MEQYSFSAGLVGGDVSRRQVARDIEDYRGFRRAVGTRERRRESARAQPVAAGHHDGALRTVRADVDLCAGESQRRAGRDVAEVERHSRACSGYGRRPGRRHAALAGEASRVEARRAAGHDEISAEAGKRRIRESDRPGY